MRDYDPDMADVRGLPLARRALEVAAAGGHHLLLVGPPGSGKSMLARRLLGILPYVDDQTDDEIDRILQLHTLVTNRIRDSGGHPSAARFFDRQAEIKRAHIDRLPASDTLTHELRQAHRPFRAPHYTVSVPGMVGQWPSWVDPSASLRQRAAVPAWMPRPGELSLAHGGVLCLDDLPEFSLAVLRAIEVTLDSGTVDLWTARRTASLPARFLLIATMTACPCGYRGHPTRPCTCPPASVHRWWERIKAIGRHFPVVVDLSTDHTGGAIGPSTTTIHERVQKARTMLDRSDRGWSVAQTIAALAGSSVVTGEHKNEAHALYYGCPQLREARTA